MYAVLFVHEKMLKCTLRLFPNGRKGWNLLIQPSKGDRPNEAMRRNRHGRGPGVKDIKAAPAPDELDGDCRAEQVAAADLKIMADSRKPFLGSNRFVRRWSAERRRAGCNC